MTSPEELREKNRVYDDATSVVWQLAVYEAVHGGWRLANIGGRAALDLVVDEASQKRARHITELCSGTGDACVYVAERLDATITGVEINRAQIEAARAFSNSRANVRFEQGDVLDWQPAQPQDLVFALDSLMLVGDLDRVLRRAWAGLRPGGRLLLWDVLAGPAIDESTRAYAWNEDGIVNLSSRDEQLERLRAIGFASVEHRDETEQAMRCFARIEAAVVTHGPTIALSAGQAVVDDWQQLTARYRDCFEHERLGYGRFAATKPLIGAT